MSEPPKFIVRIQDYDTFKRGDERDHSGWMHKEVAEKVAEILSEGWGTHAWVVEVEPPLPVFDWTLEEFEKKAAEADRARKKSGIKHTGLRRLLPSELECL